RHKLLRTVHLFGFRAVIGTWANGSSVTLHGSWRQILNLPPPQPANSKLSATQSIPLFLSSFIQPLLSSPQLSRIYLYPRHIQEIFRHHEYPTYSASTRVAGTRAKFGSGGDCPSACSAGRGGSDRDPSRPEPI